MMHEDFRKLELRNQIHQKTSKDLDKQQRIFPEPADQNDSGRIGRRTEGDVEDLIKKQKKMER
jgi:ATP-dependent Lon protease